MSPRPITLNWYTTVTKQQLKTQLLLWSHKHNIQWNWCLLYESRPYDGGVFSIFTRSTCHITNVIIPIRDGYKKMTHTISVITSIAHLTFSLCLCLSVCLSVCLSIHLSLWGYKQSLEEWNSITPYCPYSGLR